MNANAQKNEPKLLDGIMSITPKHYIDVLLTLNDKLEGKNVQWSVGGDLGEVLRTVNVEPDCLEILTTKDGAEQIVQALAEFNPEKVTLQVQQLPRNAVVEGNDYPVYIKSYYSTFNIGVVKVKVHGDPQYKVNDWEWGDRLEFTPEYVYIAGKKTAVVPLSVKYELYSLLGWTDRAEKVKQALGRQRPHRSPTLR